MKKLVFGILLTILGFDIPVSAAEFQEQAMCAAVSSNAAFPRISIQKEPGKSSRAILILMASDGWTQVYSGPIKETTAELTFTEDKQTVTARFLKNDLKARISFAGDDYVCDERSFGH